MGLEGVVSKRIDWLCRSGGSNAWVKIKIPCAPGNGGKGPIWGARFDASPVQVLPKARLEIHKMHL